MADFTIDDLRRIMLEGAGVDEGVDLDGDILDTTFTELGYDSLAMLETASRIERLLGIRLSDEEVGDADSPRRLLDLVRRTAQRLPEGVPV
ncbi:acyl carrier protein [Actinoplanes sp. NPDC049548]|uniref:acyl carrier protein n=1 Tax=Actinoplanes sp. NPDC049548 TaxID=3155152 RepID=UPI00342C9AB0